VDAIGGFDEQQDLVISFLNSYMTVNHMTNDTVSEFIDKVVRVVVAGQVMSPYVGLLRWWDEGSLVKVEPVAALVSTLPEGYRNGSGLIAVCDITDILPFREA
jgi:hypothetical protein